MLAIQTSTQQRELNALRELSMQLGQDPLLVQASTGNTSVKIGDSLWIKASGKWFIHADADDFLVSVNLSRARQCLKQNLVIPETEAGPSARCASVETAMHAVLPHKVVVHVHSINAIACAVRQDGPAILERCLHGLAWTWIPYTPSGTPLARAIERAVSLRPDANVFILANHGLVVCEDSCRSAKQLLEEVEARLAISPRPAPQPGAAALAHAASEPDWCLPQDAEVHALAADPLARRVVSGGVLYPCQAMFLPDLVPYLSHQHRVPAVLLIDGQGVLCSKHMTPAQEQVLRGLAQVVQRIDGLAPVRYLTPSETWDVLNGPAYQGVLVQ